MARTQQGNTYLLRVSYGGIGVKFTVDNKDKVAMLLT